MQQFRTVRTCQNTNSEDDHHHRSCVFHMLDAVSRNGCMVSWFLLRRSKKWCLLIFQIMLPCEIPLRVRFLTFIKSNIRHKCLPLYNSFRLSTLVNVTNRYLSFMLLWRPVIYFPARTIQTRVEAVDNIYFVAFPTFILLFYLLQGNLWKSFRSK